jgi:hypothetical protein
MAIQITPSTFGGYNNYTSLLMSQVTSSGAYFNVGDASKILIFVVNASSSVAGALMMIPGAQWSGALGLDASTTTSTDYSTSNCPSVCVAAINNTSTVFPACFASTTTGTYAVWGPFEAADVKSTAQTIYIANSTTSTRMYVSVMAMGSTN